MQVFPAILDEFGSTLDNSKELMCMQSIEAYANAKSPASSTSHAPLTSWFFWYARAFSVHPHRCHDHMNTFQPSNCLRLAGCCFLACMVIAEREIM